MRRRVLVTGASSGIGRATALAFADAGANVVLVARKGADVAILPPSVWVWGGGAWQARPVQDELRWYVFDDRAMYRPGEEVHVQEGAVGRPRREATPQLGPSPRSGNPAQPRIGADPFEHRVHGAADPRRLHQHRLAHLTGVERAQVRDQLAVAGPVPLAVTGGAHHQRALSPQVISDPGYVHPRGYISAVAGTLPFGDAIQKLAKTLGIFVGSHHRLHVAQPVLRLLVNTHEV